VPEPDTDAVWMGSALPVGTHSNGGMVAQTVAVGSQHVTVFARDDALRAEILSTAEAALVPATVEPWAGGGIKAYVAGPGVSSGDDPLAPHFRGMMG
jgi:hypothetical protein